MSKHSPGPWGIKFTPDNYRHRWSISSSGGFSLCYGDGWGCEFTEEGDANARLIAAAPDLLEALIDSVCALECCGKDYPAAEKARAAIAKARGDA